MPGYQHHLFVCTNERDEGSSCGRRGSFEILKALKATIRGRGLDHEAGIMATKSGCLGLCSVGPNLVVYPQGLWRSSLTHADAIGLLKELAKPMSDVRLSDITGLVLAGGQGRRIHGEDKGLKFWRGQPLIDHALHRLAPRVRTLLISANRNLALYAKRGYPVLPDEPATDPSDTAHCSADNTDGLNAKNSQGPLAGIYQGLIKAQTPWLMVVPCDVPLFPADLIDRFWWAAQESFTDSGAGMVQARSFFVEGQYAFCLLSKGCLAPLRHFLGTGQRRIEDFHHQVGAIALKGFTDSDFRNLNTPTDFDAGCSA